jgi:hypothetical protein
VIHQVTRNHPQSLIDSEQTLDTRPIPTDSTQELTQSDVVESFSPDDTMMVHHRAAPLNSNPDFQSSHGFHRWNKLPEAKSTAPTRQRDTTTLLEAKQEG